jgi:hypothetical protein
MAEAPVLRDEAVDKAMPHPIPGLQALGSVMRTLDRSQAPVAVLGICLT